MSTAALAAATVSTARRVQPLSTTRRAAHPPVSLRAEVVAHPSVVLGELDAVAADQVDSLLVAADVFDGCAGHVVHISRTRDWPTLTAEPGRRHRIDPAVEVALL